MSDTPRTDALLLEVNEGRVYESDGSIAEHARTLERELAAERKRADESEQRHADATGEWQRQKEAAQILLGKYEDAKNRADDAEKDAKHSLPYVVQYMRQDDSDIWHDMAAFDYQSVALMYADSCANETWKYRVIEAATEVEIVKNG